MNTIKNRKGVSPVIATVILVAVAITIAVAVSYWMSGISGQYTKFEKVEIQSISQTKDALFWTITVNLKNSGSNDATLNSVFINDKQATFNDGVPVVNTDLNYDTGGTTGELTIKSGQSATLTIYSGLAWPASAALTSGTAINMRLHTAGGMDYYKLMELV